MLLLSFPDINTAILSSSREASLLQASPFVQFSRAFTKDINAWGLGPDIRHVLRHQRPVVDQSQSRTMFERIMIKIIEGARSNLKLCKLDRSLMYK